MKTSKPIIVNKTKPMSDEEYWKMKCEGEELGILSSPCYDCAIKTGFYLEYAEELLRQPYEIQELARKRWFCHNHPRKACKGIQNMIESRRKGGSINEYYPK